jgi:hypothetical protein
VVRLPRAPHQVVSVSLDRFFSRSRVHWKLESHYLPTVSTEGGTVLQGRAFGTSLSTSSQGVPVPCSPPPRQLACWGPLWWCCVGCNLITSQPTELLVGALRSQGLCACDLPVPRSPFSVIQIRYSEPFMKILIKPETAALLFHCCFVRIRYQLIPALPASEEAE